jgi:hypothetical protein
MCESVSDNCRSVIMEHLIRLGYYPNTIVISEAQREKLIEELRSEIRYLSMTSIETFLGCEIKVADTPMIFAFWSN